MSMSSLLGGSSRKKKKGLSKPKLRKFPSMPKSTNLSVLDSHAKRCESIKRENEKKLAEYYRKVKLRNDAKDRVKKMKESIQKMKKGGKR